MPYIKDENREKFFESLTELTESITCEGDLNYIITSLVHMQLMKKGLKYQEINNLIGALECAKLELYRVIAAPYENLKMKENGNVSTLDSDFKKANTK